MKLFECKISSDFLVKRIKALPNKGRGQVTRIATYLGVSTTLVSRILTGDKILTVEQAEALTQYFGLIDKEAEFFVYLIQFERAGTRNLKIFWEDKLKKLKQEALNISTQLSVDTTLNDTDRAIFYSSPFYAAIWLFTSTENEGKLLEQIAERFELPKTKTSEIMQFLLTKGLCVEMNGRYKMGPQKTHLERSSPFLAKHHANWRLMSLQQIHAMSESELMYTAPVSLSKKDFDALRADMVDFIKNFLDRVHESPAEEIACFNLDFFWIKK